MNEWRAAVGYESSRFICNGDGPGARCGRPVKWVRVPFNKDALCQHHFDQLHPTVGGREVR